MTDPAFPALTAAIADMFAQIAAEPDPGRAYWVATALGLAGQGLMKDAARARGVALIRLCKAEGISVTDAAERVGLSKARASQLMADARAAAQPVSQPPVA